VQDLIYDIVISWTSVQRLTKIASGRLAREEHTGLVLKAAANPFVSFVVKKHS